MVQITRLAFVLTAVLSSSTPALAQTMLRSVDSVKADKNLLGKAGATMNYAKGKKGGLGGLTMQSRFEALPEDFRLEKTYVPINAENSGEKAIEFLEDGTFREIETSENLSETTVETQKGEYHIEGFTLSLVYEDGRVEEKSIAAPASHEKVILIDGEVFVDQEGQ